MANVYKNNFFQTIKDYMLNVGDWSHEFKNMYAGIDPAPGTVMLTYFM